MRKVFAAAAVSLPLWACQTASGIPCFTLTYEQSVWAAVQWPVRDLVNEEARGTMAIRQDGSFVHIVEPSGSFAVRQRRGGAEPNTRLFIAGSPGPIARGPDPLPDSRLPPMFFLDGIFRRAPDGDRGCSTVLAGIGTALEKTAPSRMLGEPVVSWKLKRGYGEVTVSLAPLLDCQVLRLEAIEYRYRYLPVRKELFEVKTLERGQPKAALFAPPKGK